MLDAITYSQDCITKNRPLRTYVCLSAAGFYHLTADNPFCGRFLSFLQCFLFAHGRCLSFHLVADGCFLRLVTALWECVHGCRV